MRLRSSMGYSLDVVRIPPARFLGIPERLFPPKRFQRDGGVAGLSKERRNSYAPVPHSELTDLEYDGTREVPIRSDCNPSELSLDRELME